MSRLVAWLIAVALVAGAVFAWVNGVPAGTAESRQPSDFTWNAGL